MIHNGRSGGEWLSGAVMGVIVTFWEGWMVAKLWAWFVVPLGVRPLGLAGAVGLSALLSIARGVRHARGADLPPDDEHVVTKLFRVTSGRTLTFGIAALARVMFGG